MEKDLCLDGLCHFVTSILLGSQFLVSGSLGSDKGVHWPVPNSEEGEWRDWCFMKEVEKLDFETGQQIYWIGKICLSIGVEFWLKRAPVVGLVCEKSTSSFCLNQSTELWRCNEVEAGVTVSLQFNDPSSVHKFHRKVIVIDEHRPKRFEPLNTQYYICSAKW